MYKFYFNFPNANKKPKLIYLVHKSTHKAINVVGSNKNGIMVDDFKTLNDLLIALKKLNSKFRDKDREFEIKYCNKCFQEK